MKIGIIDSHTAGEPTRVVTAGFPPLSGQTMAERLDSFQNDYDHLRRGIVLEPRGSDVVVGALLTEPVEPGSVAGVIFFNNVGMLGMCGHGTIGVVETLRHLGHIGPGTVRLDTPVGTVEAVLDVNGEVSVRNVPSYRFRKDVSVYVPTVGDVTGDIAWGGNWFFLVTSPEFQVGPAHIDSLTETTWAIRKALETNRITGEEGAEIDHVEVFAASPTKGVDSRSFVLCPGKEFDRSPCGTGTSAKIACLIEDGKLAEGAVWVQESVTGGIFRASGKLIDGKVLPTVTGRAHITSEATLLFNEADPYRWGLPKR